MEPIEIIVDVLSKENKFILASIINYNIELKTVKIFSIV